jgi:hypothetical protein
MMGVDHKTELVVDHKTELVVDHKTELVVDHKTASVVHTHSLFAVVEVEFCSQVNPDCPEDQVS